MCHTTLKGLQLAEEEYQKRLSSKAFQKIWPPKTEGVSGKFWFPPLINYTMCRLL